VSNEALRTGVPDRPLLTRNEAIDLIAFRDTAAPDPAGSWDEAPEWWDDYSGAPSMAAALRTIARGEHVRPPLSLPPGVPDWLAEIWSRPPAAYVELEALARLLVSKVGRSAQELAAELENAVAAFQCRVETYLSDRRDAEKRLGEAEVHGAARAQDAPRLAPFTDPEFRNVTSWYRTRDVLCLLKPAGDEKPAKKRRGTKPKVGPRVTSAMLADLRAGQTTAEQLDTDSLASLQLKYKASTGSCNKAREAAIAAFRVSEFKL
jgi:hypothetical protein